MKKRRIMAAALAVAMLSSSISFNVYADDAVSSEPVDTADEVVSGAGVNSSSETSENDEVEAYVDESDINNYIQDGYIGGLKTTVDNSGEWKASVFGSVALKSKIAGYEHNSSAPDQPYYVADEEGDDVHMSMGLFNEDGSLLEAVGKISAGQDGLTYYYKEITPDTNFEMSATATINKISYDKNQTSFGIMVRDYIIPMESKEVYAKYVALMKEREIPAAQAAEYTAISRDKTGAYTAEEIADAKVKAREYSAQAAALASEADALFEYLDALKTPYIASGPMFMNNISNSNNSAIKAVYRTADGDLSTNDSGAAVYNPLIKYEGSSAPSEGDEVEISLKKQGDVYQLKLGDQTPVTLDSSQVTLGADGKLYVGLYVTRAADITFSDIVYEETKEAQSLEIVSLPDTTTYIVKTQAGAIDTTGLTAKVTYTDGTSEILDDSQLLCSNVDLTTTGTQTVTVNYGGKSDTFDVLVDYNRVTDMTLTYKPFTLEYLTGSRFNTVGLEIDASYLDGTAETLSASQYTVAIDGEVVGSDYYFTSKDVGTHTVTVSYNETESILANGKNVTYEITVVPATLKSLNVRELPVKGTADDPYDLNSDVDLAGLLVEAVYEEGEVTVKKVLDDDEYTVSGYDAVTDAGNVFTSDGDKTLTVTFNNDPSFTTTFNVKALAKKPVKVIVTSYPRQTYFVNEAFSDKGIELAIDYSNGEIIDIDETDYTATIDTTNFDSSTAGASCSVAVVVDFGTKVSTVTIPIKIVASEERVWKATLMGASSLGVSAADPSSSITVYDNDGNESLLLTGDDGYKLTEQPVGLMTDGHMTNVSKVNVRSWAGSGKYATDHDGIAYYYTRVNAKDNYIISADVTVNGYIRNPNDTADQKLIADKKAEMQAVFDKYGIKDENGERRVVTDLEALDMVRSGQEAFGIQARDVVPLYLPYEEGGDETSITTKWKDAYKDKYGEAVDIFEAYKKQEAGVDYTTKTSIQKEDINNISFSSNIVVAGGATSSTFPTNPTTSSFKEKEVQNRITLSYRTGVSATGGAGSNGKNGFKTTTSHLPVAGDKYNITLKRINYGFSLTTYDYQTGETQTVYSFDSKENLEDLLTTQDQDNVYVGFFACRYADIDVENINFNATDAATDSPVPDLEEDIYSPKISVESDLYTESTNYLLQLKASNPSGGIVTIKQNGNVIYEDAKVSKSSTYFDVNLVPASLNEFEFVYTPAKNDLCYDYSKVVSRVIVTCKAMSKTDVIYVAPYGTVDGAATREDPLDLETAIGLVRSGQKIVMLDGVYTTRDTINIAKTASGSARAKKYVVADEGATPIVNLQNKEAGFIISADYWEFDGLTVINSGGNSKPFHIGGNHNVVKNCTFHDNGDCGLQISRTDSSDLFEDWPSNNLVLNCESFNNCDPSKNNADGFAIKLTVGNNNMFKGCVSHHNLDDGWDLYTKLSTGAIGAVIVEDCTSYRQGFKLLEDGTDVDYKATSGGNGFKAGGESIPVYHYFKDCKAFNNKGNGYDSNTNPVAKLRNVVFYNNLYSNVAMYSPARSLYSYDLEGVVSYRDEKGLIRDKKGNLDKNILADRVGSYTEFTQFSNAAVDLSTVDSNYLIWDDPASESKNNKGVVVTADFFKSVTESDSLNDKMRYERDETGAFIWGDFLARVTPYEHKAEDLVTLPYTGYDPEQTEATTDEATTTTASNGGSSRTGGGGGGGGGGSIVGGSSAKLTTVTTEADTEETTAKPTTSEDGTEVTTAAVSDNLFDDIAGKPWAVDAINSLAELGIINGVGNNKFAPDASCKRADFAIMLVNLIGIDGTATDNFDDVAPGKYYYNFVGLAKEAGIVSGYGDGNFGPENFCTREELMVMVANALKATGIDITSDTSVLDKFNDSDAVADWAAPYVAYLVEAGVVNGSNNALNPKNEITRAEVAVIMYNIYGILAE